MALCQCHDHNDDDGDNDDDGVGGDDGDDGYDGDDVDGGDDRDGRTWGKAISKSSTQWREGGQGMPMRPISQKLRFPRFPTQQLIVATAESSN